MCCATETGAQYNCATVRTSGLWRDVVPRRSCGTEEARGLRFSMFSVSQRRRAEKPQRSTNSRE